MRLRIEFNGEDFTTLTHIPATRIHKDLDGRASTANLEVRVGAEFARYDVAVYGNAVYSQLNLPSQQSEVIIYDNDTDAKIFRGFVTGVGRMQKRRDIQFWTLSCTGLEYLLSKAVINQEYVGQTDRQIIQHAFGQELPEITTADGTVAELGAALNFTAKDLTLRELLENLADIVGAEWRITEDKELSWRAQGSVAAAFGFSDSPDNQNTFIWRIRGRERTSDQFANKVTVLGAYAGVNGAELRSTAENATSQAELGRVVAATVVNREVDNQPALDLAASIELEKRAIQERITFEFDRDGLEVGELVEINSIGAGVSGEFVIQTLEMRWRNGTDTVYTAQVGDYRGDLINRMRQLDRIKNGPKLQPSVPPPPGSIGSTQLADESVTRLKIAAQAVDEARLEVAAVTEQILAAAAVTETKVAPNAISTPKLQAGSIIASKLAAASVIAGKVAADAIVGSNIQAGSITAADAVFASAAIGTADIADAAITNAKIDNLQAEKITAGFLSVDRLQVNTINGNKLLDATVTDQKISSLSVDKLLAGTITASVSMTSPNITSTSGSNSVNLSNGEITVSGSGSTTTLGEGFMVVDANFTSAQGVVNAAGVFFRNPSGIITADLLSSGTGGQLSSGGLKLYNSSGQIRVNAIVDASNNGVLGLSGSNSIVVQAGSASNVGVFINGQKIIGARRPGITTISGTADLTYGSAERDLINDHTTAINTIIVRLLEHGLISSF